MPYTLSHAAAVLPFTRFLLRWRVLSATVIGSMVPDFGYLMPVPLPRAETHSAISLITFSLPVGLLSYWIFQVLIKTPLLNLLPDRAYMRWRPFATPAAVDTAWQWILAACGVLAGAVTHLVWDAFTHNNARGIRMLPELNDLRFELHGHHLSGGHLLEDGSSLLGLVIVVAMIAYALRGRSQQPVMLRPLNKSERRMWVLSYALAALAFTVGFDLLARVGGSHLQSVAAQVNIAAVAVLRGLMLSLVAVSLFLNVRLRDKIHQQNH
jgi:hypothetical protein